MDTLVFAQTVFYLTFSLLIIVFLISGASVSYYLINIAKNLNKLSNDLTQTSQEVRENITEIMKQLSSLPFLSFFLKKWKEKTAPKRGRK